MVYNAAIAYLKGLETLKKYRPYCAGYILLYVLVLICLGDAVFTLVGQIRGTMNEYMASFSLFSYLILAMGLCYVWMYARAQVAIDDKTVRFAFPANIRPKQGEPRAMLVFRQGDCDMKFIDKTVTLAHIVRWGWVEDLGYERIDGSNATEKGLFPVHEVAVITSDNKRYHWNAAIYSDKQRREIVTRIASASGVMPEGRLAELVEK